MAAFSKYILITDEDRDNRGPASYESILSSLAVQRAALNGVVNNGFGCSEGVALGRTTARAHRATAGGGYSACGGPTTGNGIGPTEEDYVRLALASGGAAWNLNFLRAGGDGAVSFTGAFVDIKVEEMQIVPEPSTYGMAAVALGVLLVRRHG